MFILMLFAHPTFQSPVELLLNRLAFILGIVSLSQTKIDKAAASLF